MVDKDGNKQYILFFDPIDTSTTTTTISQIRILDVATGQVILVSHHPGKNPYNKLDPLGLGNSGKQHAVMGGEWESATDVSSRHPSMPSFKIRPKPMSAHGRQYIKNMHGELLFVTISMELRIVVLPRMHS